jgi:hypothetical protein
MHLVDHSYTSGEIEGKPKDELTLSLYCTAVKSVFWVDKSNSLSRTSTVKSKLPITSNQTFYLDISSLVRGSLDV